MQFDSPRKKQRLQAQEGEHSAPGETQTIALDGATQLEDPVLMQMQQLNRVIQESIDTTVDQWRAN